MYPGFFGWWKRGGACRAEACGEHAEGHGGRHCGGGGPWRGRHHHGPPFGGFGGGGGGGDGEEGGGFGVRRPLRFLAWKLELEEQQIAKLAEILDELKTERAQASVDQRRTITAFAEAIEGAQFDETKAKDAGDGRVRSAERLRDAVVKALGKMHAVLDDEQRKKLAYLLRTGALVI